MNTLKSVLLLSVTLIFTNSALAASHKEVINNNEFNETEKIIAQMYYQQQLIEKEIDRLSASAIQNDNQVKLFKNCKQPECHQYWETTSFHLDPNQNFTYQNQISKDGQSKSVTRRGKITQRNNRQTLILNNAYNEPDVYLQQ
ncbi:hypothetical protein GY065_04740 [Snodgrassella sp. ESL0323]|uniref:hypothetical protein n=1 Tax=Snodgrassella TaxID=1193515 RepID=UPI0015824A4A|nr:hypothetical protein [Snodgrassella sp. ESL0323]NUF78238.1 hypothetical protein [Snodgrassella sp. ESL0323]